MNRVRFSKCSGAVIVTVLSVVVIFNLPKVFPPSNDITSTKYSHGTNIKNRVSDDALKEKVAEKSYVDERVIDNKNHAEKKMFESSPEEDQMKKTGIHSQNYDIKDQLADDDVSVTRTTETDDTIKDDIKNVDPNLKEPSLNTDSSCGYQVFSNFLLQN